LEEPFASGAARKLADCYQRAIGGTGSRGAHGRIISVAGLTSRDRSNAIHQKGMI
jgi:hypothetical protein